jgi:hypothetical protein
MIFHGRGAAMTPEQPDESSPAVFVGLLLLAAAAFAVLGLAVIAGGGVGG